MKNSGNSAKLLDLPFAPEADALLDELERSGQFRVGLEAEVDDESNEQAASNDYSWGRGSGSVVIQDWWTSKSVSLRVGPGIGHHDLVLAQDRRFAAGENGGRPRPRGARGLPRPDSRCVHAAHHLQRRQRVGWRRPGHTHRQPADPATRRKDRPRRSAPACRSRCPPAPSQNPLRWCTGSQRSRCGRNPRRAHRRVEWRLVGRKLLLELSHRAGAPANGLEAAGIRLVELRTLMLFVSGERLEERVVMIGLRHHDVDEPRSRERQRCGIRVISPPRVPCRRCRAR